MDMGVKIKFAIMRMKDHGHADFGSQVFWIQAEVFERIRNAKEKYGKHLPLMVPCQ